MSRCPDANRSPAADTKAFMSSAIPSMSIEEAARRRDFTINAISWDPLTDAYEDPFNGRADLDRRVLRAVDLRTFGDDSLRVLRAIQFAARFEFTLDDATAALCRSIPLDDLPAERVWGELEKLLLAAERPSIGLALALDLGVVDTILPELKPLVGCEQEPDWHPEGDVWTHTLMVIDKARELNADLDRPQLIAVMLGAVCHDLGKPATTAIIDGRIRSMNHEEAGVAPTLSAARSTERPHDRRLRRAQPGRRTRRASPEARDVLQSRAGWRRRVPTAGTESRPRTACASRARGLSGPHRRLRLLGDGLVPSARARAWRRASSAGAAAARQAPSRPRAVTRTSSRRDPEAGLRASSSTARSAHSRKP